MAKVELDGGVLVVQLSFKERIGSMAKDLRVQLAAIRAVRVVEDPWPELRGRRVQGTLVPGVASLSVRKVAGDRSDGLDDQIDFVVAYKGKPTLVIDLGGVPYDRLLITCPFPEHVARAVAMRAPKLE
jgi:hypothetical protein